MKQITTLAAVVLLLGASFGQNKTRDQSTFTFTVSGVTQVMVDGIGTQYNQWEVVPAGSPASLTVTIAGCIRGGTCSATLATSSGTSAQILNTTGVYDYYNVTASWTGGTRATVTVNRTATLALSGGGGSVTAASTLVTSGLIGQYAFLDGSGTTLADTSGAGNNGTLAAGGNAPTWTAGVAGGLTFTGGAATWVDLPAGVAPSNVKTIQIYASFQNAALYSPGVAKSPTLLNTANSDEGFGFSNAFSTAKFGWASFGGWNTVAQGKFTRSALIGTALLTESMTNPDTYYINTTPALNASTNNFNTGTGNFRLGAGNSIHNAYYCPCTIYYAVFYNRALTAGEVYQNNAYVQDLMAKRGLTSTNSDTFTTTDRLMVQGDSLIAGTATTSPITFFQLNNTWNVIDPAWNAQTMALIATNGATSDDPYYATKSGKNLLFLWAGTNDAGSDPGTMSAVWANMSAYAAARKKQGWKVILTTMLSRTTADAKKNNLDAFIRANWSQVSDAMCDHAAHPLIGADGANAVTTWFNVDGIHPTSISNQNILAPIMQMCINRLYGNNDFSTAATYTTTAPAAAAITATSESTNTVTVTSALNPPVGSCVVVTGVTPAGYNSPTGWCWAVATTSAGSWTYLNPTSGLGAGSVFGVNSVASQKDADKYVILAGAATSPSFTLESCIGYTGQNIYLKNSNTTSPWVLTPFGSETIDGAATLTMPTATSGNNPVVILQSQLVSSAAGGCNWKRIQ